MQDSQYWIEHLQLLPHPEGGYYRELYRAREVIPQEGLPERFGGPRSMATSIVYLLRAGERSVFHRIRSDETWHFYAGDSLELFQLDELDPHQLVQVSIGNQLHRREHLQWTVPAGVWFASRPATTNSSGYSLLGCTVSPGFDFADFQLAQRNDLLGLFPLHSELIRQLTL